MPGDPFAPVIPGNPLPDSVALWNPLIELARRRTGGDPQALDWHQYDAGIIRVRAVGSGSTWSPLYLNAPSIPPEAASPSSSSGWLNFRENPVIDAMTPSPGQVVDPKLQGRIAIALEPYAAGQIVKAMTVGVFPAILYAGSGNGAVCRWCFPHAIYGSIGVWIGKSAHPSTEDGPGASAEVVWFDSAALGSSGGACWALLRLRRPESIVVRAATNNWGTTSVPTAANIVNVGLGNIFPPAGNPIFGSRLAGNGSGVVGCRVSVPCNFVMRVSAVWKPASFSYSSLQSAYVAPSSGLPATTAIYLMPEQKLSIFKRVTAVGGSTTDTLVKEIKHTQKLVTGGGDVYHGHMSFDVAFDAIGSAPLELAVPYSVGFYGVESIVGIGSAGSTPGKIQTTHVELTTYNEALWHPNGYSGGKNPIVMGI